MHPSILISFCSNSQNWIHDLCTNVNTLTVNMTICKKTEQTKTQHKTKHDHLWPDQCSYHPHLSSTAIQCWENKGLHFARIGKSDSEGSKLVEPLYVHPISCTVHTHSSNKLAQKLVHMQSVWKSQLAPGHNAYVAI
jgi:hypothetical protein